MRIVLLLSFLLLSMQAKILVHGHRGARAMKPENSLPAFEYAIAEGVDAIELDLAVTKDDILVVSHDPVLPVRCAGPPSTRVIRELTLKQLGAWTCGGVAIPTFDQVLALSTKGNFDFNVETKSFPDKPELTPAPAEFSKLVLHAVRKHKLEARVIVQSFDWRTLVEMHKLAPEIRLSALETSTFTIKTGTGIVSPQFKLITKERVDQAHAAGMQVIPWTVNEPTQWDELIAAGVDAIITDDPAALIAYLKAKGLR